MINAAKLLTALTLGAMLILVPNLQAFSSKEKTPAEEAAEQQKEALKKYNNGVKHMNKAREHASKGDSLFAFNYRATADAKGRKEYEKAVKDFLKATSLNPKLAEGFNNLGYCYRKLGEFEKSLEAYDSAISLDDKFAQAYEYRGETYLSMGNIAKAEKELALLTKMESPYADTLSLSIQLFKLAELEKKMNDKDKKN